MSRRSYEEAGTKHVKNDVIVGWEELKRAQSELNGHVAMLCKVFKIGQSWNHEDRIREKMLGEGLTVCPVSLLYKDHKGWDNKSGTVPPTRHVAGGHLGMNLHMSEIISDILEPLVETIKGGVEVISTEDLLARIEELNQRFSDWSEHKWWEGTKIGNLQVCIQCIGSEKYVFLEGAPELCKCDRDFKGTLQKEMKTGKEDEVKGTQSDDTVWVTVNYMKKLRRRRWERSVGWDPKDTKRIFSSTEVLPEDLQDFQSPMALIGYDVVSLYPNLDVSRIAENVKEAILDSPVQWSNIDYMEAARYIALNWTKEECKNSSLYSILPRRRGRTGTRPGIRGDNPRGKQRGDQEQWVFKKNIILTDAMKKELIATVVSIATKELFNNNFYSFGGLTYHQREGGPIGLRATCAVARLCMQLFDRKWRQKLEGASLTIWLMGRYMDDGRSWLPPLKHGWRADACGIWYCKEWEQEDLKLILTEVTKRALHTTMQGVEHYLDFTVETGEDFNDGWLPTLDTCLRIGENNETLFRYFEKDVCSSRTVQKQSAMGENMKVQILSQDTVRRLLNTSESKGAETREQIIDQYARKLRASGYSREQTRRILLNGIKGYEGTLKRSREHGKSLRTTAGRSRLNRYKKKLLNKTNWVKKGAEKQQNEKVGSNKRTHKEPPHKEQQEIKYRSENTE